MKFIFYDYETLYRTEYSLTRMDPPSYILDPRFEAICMGVAEDSGSPYIVDGPDIQRFWDQCDRNVATVSHNQLFDACISNWRFGYVPKLIVDTLAMSRTLLSRYLKSHSLASVSKFLGFMEKGSFIHQVRGMSRMDIIQNGLWPQEVEYCLHDTALCRSIFFTLCPQLPD